MFEGSNAQYTGDTQHMNYKELKEYHKFEAKLHDLPKKWVHLSLDLDWFLINPPLIIGNYFADIMLDSYSDTIDLRITNPIINVYEYIKLLDFNDLQDKYYINKLLNNNKPLHRKFRPPMIDMELILSRY